MCGINIWILVNVVSYVVNIFNVIGGFIYIVWYVVIGFLIGSIGGDSDVFVFC